MQLLNILYIVLIVAFILFIISIVALGIMFYRILKLVRRILAKFENTVDNVDTITEGAKLSFYKYLLKIFKRGR